MARPPVDSGASDAPPNTPYQKRYDYDSNGNLIYEGWALGGLASSAAAWAVRKNTYDGSNRLTQTQWAGGDTAEAHVWDNRAALSYS